MKSDVVFFNRFPLCLHIWEVYIIMNMQRCDLSSLLDSYADVFTVYILHPYLDSTCVVCDSEQLWHLTWELGLSGCLACMLYGGLECCRMQDVWVSVLPLVDNNDFIRSLYREK